VSQQTNVIAFLADCATPERSPLIARYVAEAPPDFVEVSGPFVMSLLLEALARRGEFPPALELVRRHWGSLLKRGAATCWDSFAQPDAGFFPAGRGRGIGLSADKERGARRRCVAWGAAPTYFLSAYQLGVRPLSPGFRTALVAPAPAGLAWARGRVPTPRGDILVAWKREETSFSIGVEVPEGVLAEIESPPGYSPERFPVVEYLQGEENASHAAHPGKWVVTLKGPAVRVRFRSEGG
jgi:hypothetical protein